MRKGRDRRADRYAKHRGHGPEPEDAGDHCTGRTVIEIRAKRGRHDDRERGADADLHPNLLGDAEHAEDLVEHRHDDGAAADAEQPSEHTGDDAANHDHPGKPGELADGDAEHADLRNGPPGRTATSAPLPKFVIHRSNLKHELPKQRGTSKSTILVPLIDLKFLNEPAATAAGTSNRRH